jgi:hypothetical protein
MKDRELLTIVEVSKGNGRISNKSRKNHLPGCNTKKKKTD